MPAFQHCNYSQGGAKWFTGTTSFNPPDNLLHHIIEVLRGWVICQGEDQSLLSRISCPSHLPKQPLRLLLTSLSWQANWRKIEVAPFCYYSLLYLWQFCLFVFGSFVFSNIFSNLNRLPARKGGRSFQNGDVCSQSYFCSLLSLDLEPPPPSRLPWAFPLLTLVAYIPGDQAWHMLMNVGFI